MVDERLPGVVLQVPLKAEVPRGFTHRAERPVIEHPPLEQRHIEELAELLGGVAVRAVALQPRGHRITPYVACVSRLERA